MSLELKYGELTTDLDFVEKCDNLKEGLVDIQNLLNHLLPLKQKETYDKLTLPCKIELDLILAFVLNSLHWINLRIQGVDVTEHPIKFELQRIKAAMAKWQQVKDKPNRPKVNIEAAKRFVKGGLYDHKEHNNVQNKPKVRHNNFKKRIVE